MNRSFWAPWGDELVPAGMLERHCAACRVLDLPYETTPKEVRVAVKAADPTVADRIKAEAAEAVANIRQIFSWTPDDYKAPVGDVFAVLRTGNFRHYAFWGGRGSGKSHGVADAIVELASTQKERVACAREHMARIKDSSYELLVEKIKACKWADDWQIFDTKLENKRTGSVIIFVGLTGKSGEGPEGVAKALEGITILWTDEAQLVSKRSMDVIIPTIRKSGSRLIWTWNPGEDETPVDEMFRGDVLPERSFVQSLLIEDNPYVYLGELMTEARSSFKRDKVENFRHIWRGAHLEITDATIFPTLLQGYLDFGILVSQDGIEKVSGFDFGYGGQDPSACVTAFVVPAELRTDYEPEKTKPILYVAYEAVEQAVPNHELHRLAREARADDVKYDSGNPLMGAALEHSGVVALPAIKAPGSVVAGLTTLQSMDILVSPDCPTTEAELKGLRWKTHPQTGKVLKPLKPVGPDHCVDCLRYGLSETAHLHAPSKGVTNVKVTHH